MVTPPISRSSSGLVGNGVNTTGTFPTEITAGTTYYIIATGLTATAFEFSTRVGGAAVTTRGSAMAGTNYTRRPAHC
jgi:hypothetical protein